MGKKALILGLMGFVVCLFGCAGKERVGSKNAMIYHTYRCSHVKQMEEQNKVYFMTEDAATKAGYRACKDCCGVKAPSKPKEKPKAKPKVEEKKAAQEVKPKSVGRPFAAPVKAEPAKPAAAPETKKAEPTKPAEPAKPVPAPAPEGKKAEPAKPAAPTETKKAEPAKPAEAAKPPAQPKAEEKK